MPRWPPTVESSSAERRLGSDDAFRAAVRARREEVDRPLIVIVSRRGVGDWTAAVSTSADPVRTRGALPRQLDARSSSQSTAARSLDRTELDRSDRRGIGRDDEGLGAHGKRGDDARGEVHLVLDPDAERQSLGGSSAPTRFGWSRRAEPALRRRWSAWQ